MITSPARALAALLISRGVGVNPPGNASGWPISSGSMPEDGLDNYITVYNTGTEQQGRIQSTGERIQFPLIQIRVRAKDAGVGWAKGKAVEEILDGITPTARGSVTVGGREVIFTAAHITMPLIPIGQDETNRRVLFTINAKLTVSEV